jgi:hypothetical protein
MITSKHNRRALNKRQLSIALIGNVHCFERRKLYSQATQKYVIASSNLKKDYQYFKKREYKNQIKCLISFKFLYIPRNATVYFSNWQNML